MNDKWYLHSGWKWLIIVISILLLVLAHAIRYSFILVVEKDYIYDIVMGLATNLIGIVVTVSFVQFFIDRQDENNECEQEKAQIIRYNKYLDVLTERYLYMYVTLTTRFTNRFDDFDTKDAYTRKFQFSDMADMYQMSLHVGEGLLEPTIVGFYKTEKALKDYMLRMIENIDFSYFPRVEEILQDFIKESEEKDVSGALLSNLKIKDGDRLLSDICASNIASNETNDWIGQYERDELNGNTMLPYVIFYFQIKEECRLLGQYNEFIEEINGGSGRTEV